jgi:hypothetical protein
MGRHFALLMQSVALGAVVLILLRGCCAARAVWTSAHGASARPLGGRLDAAQRLRRCSAAVAEVARYERVEITLPPAEIYADPFDPAQVEVTGEFITPSGRTLRVPGFYYQGYVRSRAPDGEEVLTPEGRGVFKVRFAWGETGSYRYRVTLRDRSGVRQVGTGAFRVRPGPRKGFVRRSAAAPLYFQYESGASCFPIGENIQMPERGGSYDYDLWVGHLADHGGNYFRFWVGGLDNPLLLEHLPASPGDGAGLGRYDQQSAWRIDHIMELGEARAVLAQMCIDSFDAVQMRSEGPWGWWERNPYNAANGGSAATPADFFRDAEAKRLFRQRLRYIVARWGYSSSLFAWELWNEWDQTTGYDSALMAAWHREMARYLRDLDPWQHLITTSFGNTTGDPAVDGLAETEFVQSHQYGATDVAGAVSAVCLEKARTYGKPHLFAELGADTGGRLERNPVILGSVLHDGLWASMLSRGAGSAMVWWWDSVERNELYDAFSAAVAFAADVDWVKENLQPAATRVRFPADDRPAGYGTLTLIGPADPWSRASAASKPRTFHVGTDGVVSSYESLSRVLHGVRNHADLHNPITFEVDYPAPGQFLVNVDGVSAHGGAKLAIVLDGKPALSLDFPSTDPDDPHIMRKYDKSYAIEVPAGAHTITAENIGADWVYASYSFTNYLAAPNLRVLALSNAHSALVWVQNRDHTWPNARKGSVAPAQAAEVMIGGLAPAEYRIEQWDTYAGRIVGTWAGKSRDGTLLITTPVGLATDVAYRVRAIR